MAHINDVDMNGVQASTGAGAIPPGEYTLVLGESDYKTSQTNSAHRFVQAVFQVVEGQYKGRKLFINYNLRNSNEIAQTIGKETYQALCVAVGKPSCLDTEALHNIPFKAIVATRPAKDKNGNDKLENIINKYSPMNGSVSGQSAPVQQARPASTPGWGPPAGAPVQQYQPQQPAQYAPPPAPEHVYNNQAAQGYATPVQANQYVSQDTYSPVAIHQQQPLYQPQTDAGLPMNDIPFGS